MALNAEALRTALDQIQSFRLDAEAPLACPACGAQDLRIEDRSARPYAEWYHLSCQGCGFDEIVHIPLGPPVMGGFD